MDIREFMDIALGAVEGSRVEVMSLESAEVGSEAVAALSQVIAELAENGSSFSAPNQTVRIGGRFIDGTYVFSVEDDGVGISPTMLEALNRLLARPPSVQAGEVSLGVTVVARLAAKHGFAVELVPSSPGTTARVVVPSGVISPAKEHTTQPVRPPTPEPAAVSSLPHRPMPDRVFAPGPDMTIDLNADVPALDVEDFLESIFAPLRSAASGSSSNGRSLTESGDMSIDLESTASVATLRVRVPGENFSVVEDEPSVLSSEAAIDLRSALTHFQDGRRDAGEQGDDAD